MKPGQAASQPQPGPEGQRPQATRLRRGITRAGMLILGTGGMLGSGALFSSTGMAAAAGPALIVAWAVAGTIYALIGVSYIELGLRFPEAGGAARYSFYSHGEFANLINAVCDLIWYVFIPPIEAVAVVEGLARFDHSLLTPAGTPSGSGSLAAFGLVMLFIPVNYFGVGFFNRLTIVTGAAKLVVYLALAIGVAVILGQPGNLTASGGFAPFGGGGVLAAIPLAMYAFGGIRVLANFAEETHDARYLRASVIASVSLQAVLYTLFGAAFVLALDWSGLGLHHGAWSSLATLAGNPFVLLTTGRGAAALLALALTVGIVGPLGDGYVYLGSGSRVLLAMGRSGLGPSQLKTISKRHGIPAWSLLIAAAIGAVITLLTAPVPTIYRLIDDTVVAGYLGFISAPPAMLALRDHRAPWTTAAAILGFTGASLVVYWSGWPSVPYGLAVAAVIVLLLGLTARVKNIKNGIWYAVHALFLLAITAIGSVGKLTLVSFPLGTLIVAVVSATVFLPWAVASRLRLPRDGDSPGAEEAAVSAPHEPELKPGLEPRRPSREGSATGMVIGVLIFAG